MTATIFQQRKLDLLWIKSSLSVMFNLHYNITMKFALSQTKNDIFKIMYFSWDEMRHALLTLSNADLHFFVSLPHILLTFQPHRVYPVVDRGHQDSSALLQQLDCKTIEQWQKGVDDIGQQQFDVVIHIQDEESLITFHINILSAPSRLGKGPISIFLRNSKFYYCKK